MGINTVCGENSWQRQDLAQYIQEEMYHFVLGPDMMERVRHLEDIYIYIAAFA